MKAAFWILIIVSIITGSTLPEYMTSEFNLGSTGRWVIKFICYGFALLMAWELDNIEEEMSYKSKKVTIKKANEEIKPIEVIQPKNNELQRLHRRLGAFILYKGLEHKATMGRWLLLYTSSQAFLEMNTWTRSIKWKVGTPYHREQDGFGGVIKVDFGAELPMFSTRANKEQYENAIKAIIEFYGEVIKETVYDAS